MFRNDVSQGSTNIPLGSDNLNVPTELPGFSVVGVLQALPDGSTPALSTCPQKLSQSGSTCWYSLNATPSLCPGTTCGSTVGFRNLNLSPGQSASFILQLVTPPPSTTACTTSSPCFFTDEAKQSNDFSGTGNDLNSESSSAYGTTLAAMASCPKNQGCQTTLNNGGTPTGAGGSISVTITTSSGKNTVTQIESLDYGHFDATYCSGVSSVHYEYDKLLGSGSDRAQTVTITTTIQNYPSTGHYVQEVCLDSNKPFTAKVVDANDNFVPPLVPAHQTTLPDGSLGYQGLLPDCGTKPLAANQVDCSKNPGVERNLSNPDNGDGTSTTVIASPPGFDALRGN
jgi:hypothetical protein